MKKSKFNVVRKNKNFNNFLISPNFLKEKYINFVYTFAGQYVSKIIPVDDIKPRLTMKQIFKLNPETNEKEHSGDVFVLPASVVYRYNSYII